MKPARLSARARAFLSATPPRFATIATINPDGSPHQTVIWYLLRDDHMLVNSMVGRRWPSNLRRDPRISLVVEDGLDYVAISALATEDGDAEQAQADIATLARRYETPADAERLIANRFRKMHRVSFRLSPQRIHEHWEGD